MSIEESVVVKKRKLQLEQDEEDTTTKPARLRCEFFILQKNRLCSMTRRADSKFCAEHSTTTAEDRIPCPKDPSHSVWLKNLSKHLKKCNAAKQVANHGPYFKENINWELQAKGEDLGEKISSLQEHKDDFLKFIKNLKSRYGEKFQNEDLPLEDKFDKEDALNSRFEELQDHNQKHIIQQSSMISHLTKIGLLLSNGDQKTTILEFGCGRLELSRYVNKFINSKGKFADFLLIDRSSPRLKYDTKFIKDFKETYKEGDFNSEVERFKIDIKDLSLDASKILDKDAKIFAISKHLCGVATDLTLRCCLNSQKFTELKGSIVIAMCCRHCCRYDQLLKDSKNFLRDEFEIDRFKFDNYLVKLSSWATCGKRDNQEESHFTGFNYDERLSIGLMARRIIDESRRYAMQRQGYNVKICKYVQSQISLENHLMICTHK